MKPLNFPNEKWLTHGGIDTIQTVEGCNNLGCRTHACPPRQNSWPTSLGSANSKAYDTALVLAWLQDFMEEAVPGTPIGSVEGGYMFQT